MVHDPSIRDKCYHNTSHSNTDKVQIVREETYLATMMRCMSVKSFWGNIRLIQKREGTFRQDFLMDTIILFRTSVEFTTEKR